MNGVKKIESKEYLEDKDNRGLDGYLDEAVSEARIIEMFGEPERGRCNDGKATVEWFLQMASGEKFSIYDYKGSKWHIGGPKGVSEKVRKMFGYRY